MANQIKLSRYEEIIKQVINNCLVQEINNPIAKYGVVTSVKLTHDLEIAHIYLDCLKREDINKVVENVNKVKGYLRKKISEVLNTYKTPQLVFLADKTIDYANKIEELISKINNKD